MSSVVTTPSHVTVRKLDLSDRYPTPTSDLGGFNSLLHGSLPAVEIISPTDTLADLHHTIQRAIVDGGVLYVLLDLNHHNSLNVKHFAVVEISNQLSSIGCRLLPYNGGNSVAGRSFDCMDRDTAIEECLNDWKSKLLPRFSW